jgi:hypothetical protein
MLTILDLRTVVRADRGKPILRMVPEIESPVTLSGLVAEGTATAPAEQGMPDLIPDLIPDLVPEMDSLSDVLLADRQRERGR